MFTSLFQLEQKPVTVFSSDDAGAPILTKDAGSLKTLLKACLVTGYGDKASLGWQMLFESADTLSAAFASTDPTASKYVLKIDDQADAARFSVYSDMTSIDTGINAMVESAKTGTADGAWRLIGHSKAFVLLRNDNAVSFPNVNFSYPILFGDLPRETKRPVPVVAFWTTYYRYFTGGLQSVLFYNTNGTEGKSTTYSLTNATSHPFVINNAGAGFNLSDNTCKFTHRSSIKSATMYEVVASALPDSTWTIIPMLQPLSSRVADVGNLGRLSPTAIKTTTGMGEIGGYNADCAVPTDWWWA